MRMVMDRPFRTLDRSQRVYLLCWVVDVHWALIDSLGLTIPPRLHFPCGKTDSRQWAALWPSTSPLFHQVYYLKSRAGLVERLLKRLILREWSLAQGLWSLGVWAAGFGSNIKYLIQHVCGLLEGPPDVAGLPNPLSSLTISHADWGWCESSNVWRATGSLTYSSGSSKPDSKVLLAAVISKTIIKKEIVQEKLCEWIKIIKAFCLINKLQ